MGVQSDYLIAHESEAETIFSTLCPLTDGRWKGIDAKRFDMVPMSELMAVLTGEADVGKLMDEWVSLSVGEDQETWLFKLPDRLVSCLAALADTRLEQVAQDWVAQESFPGKWHIEMEHKPHSPGGLPWSTFRRETLVQMWLSLLFAFGIAVAETSLFVWLRPRIPHFARGYRAGCLFMGGFMGLFFFPTFFLYLFDK